MSKIRVGNLSWSTTDDSLRLAFAEYGAILDAIVMRDPATGRSQGFGFVTYSSEEEAKAAIKAMDGRDLDTHLIKVSVASATPQGGAGGGGDSGGSGEYGGGGGDGGGSGYGGGGYGGGYGGG